MERRDFVRNSLGAALAAAAAPFLGRAAPTPDRWTAGRIVRLGAVNHSVCKWCYPSISLEALAAAGSQMGLRSIELLDPEGWATVKEYGLTCAIANGPVTGHHPLNVGWNHTAHHEFLVPAYLAHIDAAADAGLTQIICFSGTRDGLPDDEGLANCAEGLKQVLGRAEARGITLVMELLNSKVDHKDYQCDRTPWGAALVDQVGSDHFKLLYDIYHMQIMEGDVIRTIREYKDYIAHYHTGGNPGRNEIDETQELNYPAILRAIVDLGFTGYVAQEFIPTRAPLQSLGQAISLCDVSA